MSSKCDVKAENSSTFYKFHEGRKGLRPMGFNADLEESCRPSWFGHMLSIYDKHNE